jgi:hypothetical protein
MKSVRKISLALLVVAILSVLVAPTFAQSQTQRTVTVTVTEAEINSSFRVTNPARVTVSNKSVDLQAGQIVVTATYTPRRSRNGASYTVQTTLVPTLSNGRVTWTATGIVVNGSNVTDQQITAANNAVASGWRSLAQGHIGSRNTVTALTITDTDITYTVIRGS